MSISAAAVADDLAVEIARVYALREQARGEETRLTRFTFHAGLLEGLILAYRIASGDDATTPVSDLLAEALDIARYLTGDPTILTTP